MPLDAQAEDEDEKKPHRVGLFVQHAWRKRCPANSTMRHSSVH